MLSHSGVAGCCTLAKARTSHTSAAGRALDLFDDFLPSFSDLLQRRKLVTVEERSRWDSNTALGTLAGSPIIAFAAAVHVSLQAHLVRSPHTGVYPVGSTPHRIRDGTRTTSRQQVGRTAVSH